MNRGRRRRGLRSVPGLRICPAAKINEKLAGAH